MVNPFLLELVHTDDRFAHLPAVQRIVGPKIGGVEIYRCLCFVFGFLFPKGKRVQDDTKCSCPIWCDGELNGKRHRQSLKTRDLATRNSELAAIEDPKAPRVKSVADAITA
jgi:hypothetical protein